MIRRFLTGSALALLAILPLQALSFNSRADVAMGLGGAVASINEKPVMSPAGGTSWVDDNTVVYQVCREARCLLETYNSATGQYVEVADGGANQISAGGGVWAAWLAGKGLYTSTAFNCTDCGPAVVGPDGAIAYRPQYHSFGPTVLRDTTGNTVTLTTGTAEDIQLLGNGKAIWREGFNVAVAGLPQPKILPTRDGLWRPRAAFVNGEWWISYFHGGRGELVVHPFDSFKGYVLHHGEHAFGHAIMGQGSILVAAYAWTEGEQPGDLRRTAINVAAEPRIDLNVALEPPPVVVTPPVVTPPVVTPGQAIGRDVKHPYEREDNDRDECNRVMADGRQCDRRRGDPIHQTGGGGEPQQPPPSNRTFALPQSVCTSLTDAWNATSDHSLPSIGRILNAVAWKHRSSGWGLSGKDFGTHVDSPAGKIASDILQFKNDALNIDLIFDVIYAADDPSVNRVTCGEGMPAPGGNRPWVAPADPGGTIPGPVVVPGPISGGSSDMRAEIAARDQRIAELESERDQLKGEIDGARRERDEAINQVKVMQAKIDTISCRAELFGVKVPCKVNK